jgi:hypothetical protein
MTWKDRLSSEITLTSPRGVIFTALWRGGPRDAEKTLGIFKLPGRPGAVVQDLERGAIAYTLTIYFDGPDHDIISERFFSECGASRGIWGVVHPSKGRLRLQLASYSEAVEPVVSGNVTIFTTEWIEPRAETFEQNARLAASETKKKISDTNVTTAAQFEENIKLDTYEEQAQVIDETQSLLINFEKTIEVLAKSVSEVKRRTDSIRRDIVSNITSPIIQVNELAAQIQNLMQVPSVASNNIENTSELYRKFLDSVFSTQSDNQVEPNTLASITKNKAAIKELAAVSSICAISDSIIEGNLSTRTQTVGISTELNEIFENVTNALDQFQDEFQLDLAIVQYFSQSQSYNDTALTVSQALRYLILSAFDLKIEKRYTLKEPSLPVALAIEAYGGLGENDSNVDFFLDSNGLKDNEIMLLQPGREVLVYV